MHCHENRAYHVFSVFKMLSSTEKHAVLVEKNKVGMQSYGSVETGNRFMRNESRQREQGREGRCGHLILLSISCVPSEQFLCRVSKNMHD